jgi:hypothetical protein
VAAAGVGATAFRDILFLRPASLLNVIVSQHGKASMTNTHLTTQEAIAVAHRADGYLRGFRPDPRRALQIVQSVPKEFGGADLQAARIALGALCAVTGDCYRMLGDVATAADWYRRAAGHWQGGLGYPFLYADLVVQHQLAGHYQIALDCLRSEEAYWRSKPLLSRLSHSLRGLWWLYPSGWKQRWRERSLSRRLEALNQDREGAGRPA